MPELPQLLCWHCGTRTGNPARPGSQYCAACAAIVAADPDAGDAEIQDALLRTLPAELHALLRTLPAELRQLVGDEQPDAELWDLVRRAWPGLLTLIHWPPCEADYKNAAAWAFAAAEALLAERQRRRDQP